MVHSFHIVSEKCSRVVTENYSTSFSSAIRMLHKDLRKPVFNIYGFVRFADEIVDTFHDYDKTYLLEQFKTETYDAIKRGISLNPILNSFQRTVNEFHIDHKLIEAFFQSMEMDLNKKVYDAEGYNDYIYGSAEVVGLMCLYVFCEGQKELFDKLESSARSLGAAFQKVNFLRDIKDDYKGLARVYFPGCDFNNFTESEKKQIEDDILNDFRLAYQGIGKLPLKARFGVYVAYKYYFSLFKKIKRMKPARVLEERIRIPNYRKALIFLRAGVKNQLRLI
ncbi:MAG: phytoene/squalene synthase family protein [Chitinophagaceae bacterium]|nr:phytoene/squalene synthase family protein [Chitinophagaceae bacterium]MBL0272533.1 phytoene/squalene synthase family protein [Chitinophagaceae bacterium]